MNLEEIKRNQELSKAQRELHQHMADLEDKYDLKGFETYYIVLNCLLQTTKACLRWQREGKLVIEEKFDVAE